MDVAGDILDGFLAACHQVARRGLVRCSSGNVSVRLDETRMLVSATRSWMETITAGQVAVCRIADGERLEGPKPTVELGFHAGILRARPEVNVVLHFQTPHATALACRAEDGIDFNVIPEIPFYIGPVARVPYLVPGSRELAAAVADAMRKHDMVVMSNHGLVTVAADYAHAIQNAEFFELACQVITLNHGRSRPLSAQDVAGLQSA
jgi:ribulose-5-phosphate 4-epimerase/fuculose-1-phosphate aldolase